MASPSRRVAVIGAGFGGLAVAIRLQAAGLRTVLYEAREQPGGRASVWRKDGFIFDEGPTVITAPHCLAELFEQAGKQLTDYLELLPVHPFYRLVWSDGDSFEYDGDSTRMIAQIEARSPADAAGYLRFVDYARQVFEAGYLELAATPFLRFSDMVRVAPALIRLRADRSVYAAVAQFVADEHIRQALSFHSLLVGGHPFDTSAIYTLIHYLERKWGVFFPRGGTGALVDALVRLYRELGGELCLGAPVENVDVAVEKGTRRVHHRLSSRGHVDVYDAVVSNADVHHTYRKLFGMADAGHKMARRLERLDWSMSLFVLYFGTDRTYRDQVAHHTVLFSERYKALLDEIFFGDSLPADFSLYLHAPTVTDPSMAPDGCDAFYVLCPVPHLGHASLDWHRVAPAYAERILIALEVLLPDLRKHIVCKRWITPLHFRDELNAYLGSAFSCAPKLTQSAWFRPHNRDDHIPGLYLVGAGTHPGAGVPGVINSAKATAGLVLEDLQP